MPAHSASQSRRQGCFSTLKKSLESSLMSILMRRMNSSSQITV